MPKPHLWIIAGPNGAGKTTLVQEGALGAALSSCEFINPDALTLEYLKQHGINSWAEAESQPELLKTTFIRAAEDSQRLLEQRVESGGSVAIESVLSTQKYCSVVKRVRELGGKFMLVYVALHSPYLSRTRVDQRCREAGHDVPTEKLESRWQASLALLPWFAAHAHQFWILDNSEPAEGGVAKIMLTGSEQQIRLHGIPGVLMRPIAAEIVTQHSRLAPPRQWRIEFDDPFVAPT